MQSVAVNARRRELPCATTTVCTVNSRLSSPPGYLFQTCLRGALIERGAYLKGRGLFNFVKRITGSKKKRKKQTRVTVPYFLFWTRAMTVENGDLSDVIPVVQVMFNIYFHPWEPIEIYE